jgi:hypothetical protein
MIVLWCGVRLQLKIQHYYCVVKNTNSGGAASQRLGQVEEDVHTLGNSIRIVGLEIVGTRKLCISC